MGGESIMSFILFFLPAALLFAALWLNEMRISLRWKRLMRGVYGDTDTQ